MGGKAPSQQTVTQKTEIDPIQKSFLFGTPLPEDYRLAMEARNREVMGLPPLPEPEPAPVSVMQQVRGGRDNSGPSVGSPLNATDQDFGGYAGRGDTFGGTLGYGGGGGGGFSGGNNDSYGGGVGFGGIGTGGLYAQGGIVGLPAGGMGMPGPLPNLSDREQAYLMGMQALQGATQPMGGQPMMQQPMAGYAVGGYVEGPGTGRSDDIPATIYQDGVPVQDAALSDGEFVMTERAVRGAGGGDREEGAARMYEMMRRFENGGGVA